MSTFQATPFLGSTRAGRAAPLPEHNKFNEQIRSWTNPWTILWKILEGTENRISQATTSRIQYSEPCGILRARVKHEKCMSYSVSQVRSSVHMCLSVVKCGKVWCSFQCRKVCVRCCVVQLEKVWAKEPECLLLKLQCEHICKLSVVQTALQFCPKYNADLYILHNHSTYSV